MKCLLSVIIVNLLLCHQAIAQESYVDKNGNTHLWGPVTIEQLSKAPYDEWFLAVDSIVQQESMVYDIPLLPLEEMTVKIFIGTWCGDTKEWLPRFMQRWTLPG